MYSPVMSAQLVTACWNSVTRGQSPPLAPTCPDSTGSEAEGSSWVFLLFNLSLSWRLESWVTQASTMIMSWLASMYSDTVWSTRHVVTWNIWVGLEARMLRYVSTGIHVASTDTWGIGGQPRILATQWTMLYKMLQLPPDVLLREQPRMYSWAL